MSAPHNHNTLLQFSFLHSGPRSPRRSTTEDEFDDEIQFVLNPEDDITRNKKTKDNKVRSNKHQYDGLSAAKTNMQLPSGSTSAPPTHTTQQPQPTSLPPPQQQFLQQPQPSGQQQQQLTTPQPQPIPAQYPQQQYQPQPTIIQQPMVQQLQHQPTTQAQLQQPTLQQPTLVTQTQPQMTYQPQQQQFPPTGQPYVQSDGMQYTYAPATQTIVHTQLQPQMESTQPQKTTMMQQPAPTVQPLQSRDPQHPAAQTGSTDRPTRIIEWAETSGLSTDDINMIRTALKLHSATETIVQINSRCNCRNKDDGRRDQTRRSPPTYKRDPRPYDERTRRPHHHRRY